MKVTDKKRGKSKKQHKVQKSLARETSFELLADPTINNFDQSSIDIE